MQRGGQRWQRRAWVIASPVTRDPIVGATVALTGAAVTAQKNTLAGGVFFLDLDESTNYDLLASATGYLNTGASSGACVAGTITRMADINMQPDLVTGDLDGDGIPDAWETSYGLDPTDATDALADPDGDGRTNLDEYLNSTNPLENNAPTHPTTTLVEWMRS